ncbi:cyclodeaminase/cyclohydrolase family protein [Desulforhabdus amnigena]|jgi:formiminotetrahydrofolate cyclodeaminase|uniref:Methenyltetrahydrofolate cyclohydrolase n=1 Tax=Desulforhabdus amnigena TaxID=40218 RepID=A0A9W6FRF1_9BACT|nr:cyclodeaminase/cyclohydrolase family protein [Desulforhabdus amnigena]NLJ27265.1 cyclodeaminase/cyclohydrolase family protein [Deltaproteobacteria bacterium]GLI32913.1 methenyltetrahydrofolate cyclohydrolase [Desulforhabdus amnigena]
MTQFRELPVFRYVEEVASPNPTPGGGSVAALCGALGAALSAMVAGITLKREKFKDAWNSMEKVKGEAEELSEIFLRLAEDDSKAYLRVLAAYGLPKGTEAEKAARQANLQEAFKKAAEVPLQTLRVVERLMRGVEKTIKEGNPNALNDAGAAAYIARAAGIIALQNIRTNLFNIRDASFVREYEEETRELMENIDGLFSRADAMVRERLP